MDNNNELANPDYSGAENETTSGITTGDEETGSTIAKYQTADQQKRWQKELNASREEHKEFIKRGFKIVDVYADKRDDKSNRSNYNKFFANTEVKQAALYANTPKADIKRRFNDPADQPSRVGAEILTRNIEFEMDMEGFDGKAKQMVFDRLVPGIGIGWVRYEKEGGDVVEQPHPLAGQVVPHPQDPTQLMQVPEDATQTVTTPITHECAAVDYVAWDDFLWAPCRTWDMCRWVGRRIPMSKEAVEKRFAHLDKDTLNALSFVKDTGEQKKGDERRSTPKHNVEETTDVFEIWDKEEGLVWWISESADIPLDVVEDTVMFDGFFPTPMPPLARVSTSNTVPISDYSEVQDLYRELDTLSHRCSALTQMMQLKGVYDKAFPELKDLLLTTVEGELVPVNDWAAMNEKGGLAGAVQFLPLEELVKSYSAMSAARDAVAKQIDDIEGISDMFRGQSTANETTTATALKSAFGTARISITQQDVATYMQGLLRLKAHIICKFYDPQTLMQRAGQMSDTDMQFVQPALQVLKNGAMNHYRLDVSVDSIQLPNWNLEKAERTEVLQALFQGIQQVSPLAQQEPQLVPFLAKLVKFGVSGFKGAQEIEGDIDQMLQMMTQMAAQKAQQPPKPTPQEVQAQTKQQQAQTQLQIAQDDNQTKLQIAQLNAQMEAKDLQLRQNEQEIERLKLLAGIHDNAHQMAHKTAVHVTTPVQAIPGV